MDFISDGLKYNKRKLYLNRIKRHKKVANYHLNVENKLKQIKYEVEKVK